MQLFNYGVKHQNYSLHFYNNKHAPWYYQNNTVIKPFLKRNFNFCLFYITTKEISSHELLTYIEIQERFNMLSLKTWTSTNNMLLIIGTI